MRSRSLIKTGLVLAFTVLLTIITGCGDDGGDDDPVIKDNNQAPVAKEQSMSTHVLMPVEIILEATDPDGDELEWIIDNYKTEHGLLTGIPPEITYTPDPDYSPYPEKSGVDSFTYYVNDGMMDSNTVTIEIEITTHKPVAYSQSIEIDEDLPVSIVLMASDPDLDQLSWEIESSPINGTIDTESGGITGEEPDLLYTPNEEFHGTDSFSFRVNDGFYDSNIATVEISIISKNDIPTAYDQSIEIGEDSIGASVTLSASDVEDDSLEWVIESTPQHGTIDGTAPDITYTPSPEFSGSDSITFHVIDLEEGKSNTAIVRITVKGVSDRWYVDAAAKEGGDGRSWDSAFRHPMDAMVYAGENDEVWIREGTYVSKSAPDPVLTMNEGVSVYGGFDAGLTGEEESTESRAVAGGITIFDGYVEEEESTENRDLVNDITIFDGEDFLCHVVLGADNAQLDGITITRGATMKSNKAFNNRGAGMYITDAVIKISNCKFLNNSAYLYGGAIYNAKSSVIMNGCEFNNNVSGNLDGPIFAKSAGAGGAIYSDNSTITITGCMFNNNSSKINGGCMHNYNCSLFISESEFNDNSCGRGGAIYNSKCTVDLVIRECSFSNNSGTGGGIYNTAYSSPDISYCNFSNNSGSGGGAIRNDDYSSPAITECIFNGNSSHDNGGGAIKNTEYSSLVITQCEFNDNSSHGNGGAIYNSGSISPIISDCEFRHNKARIIGGGIYNNCSSPVITNCLFYSNETTENRGGAFGVGSGVLPEGTFPIIKNCLFINNYSRGTGAAISALMCMIEITSCTFTGNESSDNPGSVLYFGNNNDNESHVITNCILWGNGVGNPPVDNDPEHPMCIVINCSDLEGEWPGAGEGNIYEDPLFAAGPLGDCYLSQTAADQGCQSPCVNSGSGTAQDLELGDRTTRTDNVTDYGIVDMGYHYEP